VRRVTRLGEFSRNGSLFSLDSYLKIDEDSYIFGYFNPTFKAMYYFCPKTYWATLWTFLSQAHQVTLDVRLDK
jgi:hypothetical protein